MNLKVGNKLPKYLVETALLGHGLVSIDDETILSLWPKEALLTWVEDGGVRIGNIEEFIPARKNSAIWKRLDGLTIHQSLNASVNAFLTASGTMAVAQEIGSSVVVTAGMGGIGDIKAEKLCYDLPALAQSKLVLVATSPKDMLDIGATLAWFKNNGVKVYGYESEVCTGFLLNLEEHLLDGQINHHNLNVHFHGSPILILNPIDTGLRLRHKNFLTEAIACGKDAEEKGEHFHPAANACFDRLSQGTSSQMQLNALISNIKIAQLIV